MEDNLKDLFLVQKTLQKTNYLDISRISNEMISFCKRNDSALSTILQRIENYEPWEYIKGEVEFLGNIFKINKDVLIPRAETEQLALLAKPTETIIDMGTGSGCIIISLAKLYRKQKGYKYFGVDLNQKALELARENAVLHKVNTKVSFLQSNLLNKVLLKSNTLIIANLPYVPTVMYLKLDKSVLDFEPRDAIDGGQDGLRYYKLLINQIKERILHLYNITLLIEIEPSTLSNLEKFIEEYNYSIFKDYRGLDRFVLIHFC